MKKDKKARMKKLDEKYGIPYLSKASKKATAARNYYELFLNFFISGRITVAKASPRLRDRSLYCICDFTGFGCCFILGNTFSY